MDDKKQKAIKFFKKWISDLSQFEDEEEAIDYLNFAIEALEPKKIEPCEYCMGDVNKRKNLVSEEGVSVYIDGNNTLTLQWDNGMTCDCGEKLKSCLMCGRELQD